MLKNDLLDIKSFELGSLTMQSKIHPEAREVVTSSCSGQFTESVVIGKSGVGKSTVASLISSKPGLFVSASTSSGTTTLGTWISSAVSEGPFAVFADGQFRPISIMPDEITPLDYLR